VLNAFSFSGGFSLYAARGGARHVTDLDISPHALESSRRNWKLNEGLPGVISCGREWVQGDTFDWLGQNAGKRYDLIILDPPSFAKKESDREGAIRAYTRLARLGASRLEPKGMLVCCSCSAHVRDSEFFEACAQGAGAEGGFDEVSRTGHALDHPAGFREFTYLKALYLRRRA
jgi:23S rRNA (cytosine1962-C5)-methyltransferase